LGIIDLDAFGKEWIRLLGSLVVAINSVQPHFACNTLYLSCQILSATVPPPPGHRLLQRAERDTTTSGAFVRAPTPAVAAPAVAAPAMAVVLERIL
jgi:hypothetical protein